MPNLHSRTHKKSTSTSQHRHPHPLMDLCLIIMEKEIKPKAASNKTSGWMTEKPASDTPLPLLHSFFCHTNLCKQ